MLFIQECRKIMGGLSYWLFAAILTFALFSQGVFQFGHELLQEPEPGGSYGMKQEENPELIMPAAFQSLWREFCANDYTTYPIGFVKHSKLDENKREKIAAIIAEITGIDKNILLQRGQESANSDDAGGASFQIGKNGMQPKEDGGFTISPEESKNNTQGVVMAVRDDMSYARFTELMQQIDDLLGGGSHYAADQLLGYGSVPLTYEEAKERYNLAVDKDHITGGYARLFADYAGAMVLSLFPVFLAVILCMKDRRAKMQALIYTKKASSAKLVCIRYSALISSVMMPVIILSYVSNIPVWGANKGFALDYLAPLTYDLGWLLPSVMMSTAVGMFLTELTHMPIAVAVQGFWWLLDMNMGMKSVQAGTSLFRLAPRHNAGAKSWFRTQDYLDHHLNLVQNRLLFAGLALFFILCTIFIYERKRRGKFDGNKFFQKAVFYLRNRRDEPKA